MRITNLLAALLLNGCCLFQAQITGNTCKWKTLRGDALLVIGHRGASGYLPEHTLESYRRAIELGADFIKPDLVITKDGVLIARHEPLLDCTTEVVSRPEFASKKTTKLLDGIATTDLFASDLALEESKRLRTLQPNAARSHKFNGMFEIHTFDEVLDLVDRAKWELRRTVGVYPETKHPSFHYALGLPLEDELLRLFEEYGMDRANSPVFIQSFKTANLQYLSKKTKVRLVQLIDADDFALDGSLTFAAPYDKSYNKPYDRAILGDPRGFADMVKPASLSDIAKYAAGIGPWKRYIVSVRSVDANNDGRADDVNRDGRVNDDDKPTTPPSALGSNYNGDPKNQYIQYFLLGVEGVFADFPDTGVAGRTAAAALRP